MASKIKCIQMALNQLFDVHHLHFDKFHLNFMSQENRCKKMLLRAAHLFYHRFKFF